MTGPNGKSDAAPAGFNLSAWAVSQRSVVIYFILMAIVAGLFSYLRLGRNEDPAFVIKSMVVVAVWPGATVEDTLRQVTDRLERQLEETPNLDFLRSSTIAGRTTIFVNLKQSVPADVVQDHWYRVRNLVNDIRHTLPQGVQGPFFNDRFGDTFGIIYGFTADGFTHRELRDRITDIRAKLLAVPDVAKVEMIGEQDERVFVEFSLADLAARGIDRQALIAALQAQNAVRPAGALDTSGERISLRVSGAFESEADIREINLAVGGQMVRLADIATVRRAFVDPAQPIFRVNGRDAIGLGVAMREGGDILGLGERLRERMARIMADTPVGIEATLVADQSVVVDEAIDDFMTSLWQAVGIILAISFISLGVRPGLVVALAIPLTLAIVFAVMFVMAIDMQRISLGALIIALALLVDDAMTTTDATLTRLAAGDPPPVAASYAYRRYGMAMLAGTFVTIAGFVPIGFAASSAGEYTFTLFAVVSIALIASWFVAIVFAPVIGMALLKPPAPDAVAKPSRLLDAFRALLSGAIRVRWLTIGATLGAFIMALMALPLVPRQFFPASDRPELLVDLRMPQNASMQASQDMVARFDAAMAKDPDIARFSTYVGRGAIRFYLPLNVQLANDFFNQSVVVARSVDVRDELQARIETLLAREFPQVVGRVYPLELGPPVGWPLQYRVTGEDIPTLRATALELAQVIAANPATMQINFEWIEPTRELRIVVDQDEARRLGLSSQTLAALLNTVLTGTTVTQIRDDIHLVDVALRAVPEDRVSIETLRSLQVALPDGRSVPLSQFVGFSYEQGVPLIWRRDRTPSLIVQADLKPGVLPETAVSQLAAGVAAVDAKLPLGYRIETGGTVEESAQSQASVIAVVPLMLLIMLTVLMLELKSFVRLGLVLSVAPLGLIGVVAALLASGRPLGFVALLGVLALLGMITKNAVLLLSQIEAERAAGKEIVQAALDASVARFRPITLTAVSTILGMIPIAPTVFWGPMAFAIMGGLLVATLLTLVFLPTLYVAVMGPIARRAGRATA
jgi:multidrug efflux pump subunit AcrB